jgi:4-carboxymuconolactone decarboxylase
MRTETFGRYAEVPVEELTPEQRAGYDLLMRERGMVPGPSKIWLQNPDVIELTAPLGIYFQLSHSSLSDAEREIAVNVINAKWMASYATYEHQQIGQHAGLAPEQVTAIVSGVPATFEDRRQQVVHDLSTTLVAPRPVSTELYKRAVSLLGDRGVTDVTVLIGYFTMVALTLNAYDVPWTAKGLLP